MANLHGVDVLNINELANSLKPVVLPGETMKVFILKEGKEYNQGVAYLDDGTMVVVDNAKKMISRTVDISVTSVLQTTAGKMIFGRFDDKVHQVYEVAAPHAVPILGQGGICDVGDALEFLIAGASAVGVGTALFYDPLACRKINEGIEAYLWQHDFGSVSELTGSMRLPASELDTSQSG